MQLELTSEETSQLRDAIQAYLPELRRETAGTDSQRLQHVLALRLAFCERLLTRLDGAEAPAPAADRRPLLARAAVRSGEGGGITGGGAAAA